MSSKKRPKSVLGTGAPGLSTCTVMLFACANVTCVTRPNTHISTSSLDLRVGVIRLFIFLVLLCGPKVASVAPYLARYSLDELNFFHEIWLAVIAKDLVKPD